MSVRFAIEPLAKAHRRADFTCGSDRINSYFRETVSRPRNLYLPVTTALGMVSP